MTDFWQLPAAATFLRRVSEDVREGNNIVVALPDHAPVGWSAALGAWLPPSLFPQMQEFQPNGDSPIHSLYQEFGLGPCSSLTSVSDLCANEGFRSRLIHVRQFDAAAWSSWSTFLYEYEDACRQFDLSRRTLFIATIQGELAAQPPQPANLLRVHSWMDNLDSLNARLYAASLLSGSPLLHWQRQLAVAMLAELALWDPEVIALGASKSLADILSPKRWLASVAAARSWSAADDLKSPLAQWRGLRQPFEGRPRTHSAWLAMSGRDPALTYRVWAAQMSVLFPLLERHRRAILSRYGPLLRAPWQAQYITVIQLEELELTHIADQLRPQSRGALGNLYDFVCWLRDIRNDLAHLTPVDPQQLLNTRFVDAMDNLQTDDE